MQHDNEIDAMLFNVREAINHWGSGTTGWTVGQSLQEILNGIEILNNKIKSCPVCALRDASE